MNKLMRNHHSQFFPLFPAKNFSFNVARVRRVDFLTRQTKEAFFFGFSELVGQSPKCKVVRSRKVTPQKYMVWCGSHLICLPDPLGLSGILVILDL